MSLHCMSLHGMSLHGMSLHGMSLHCMSLHCMSLHCMSLHCMSLHCMSDACHALHLAFTCNKPYTVFAQSLDHFEIDEILAYVDNTLSSFNIANMSTRLTGVHWQQTLYMGLFRSISTKWDFTTTGALEDN